MIEKIQEINSRSVLWLCRSNYLIFRWRNDSGISTMAH